MGNSPLLKLRKLGDVLAKIQPRPAPEFRIQVRRPDDLVIFDVIFGNLKPGPAGPSPYVMRDPAVTGAAYIVVEFPPQSFGEQAWLDEVEPATPPEPIPNLPSSKVRMAGKSRLAFTMPPDTTQLPLTFAAIMQAIRTWPQRRDAIAAPDPIIRGRDWLKAVTDTEDWRATTFALNTAFQAQTSAAALQQLTAAASRVASNAGAGPIEDAVNREIDALAQNIPALREADARSLAFAALSAKATETIAETDVPAIVSILLSPHQPAPSVTALEMPYRLIVSPIESARWLHKDVPMTDARTGRTELWHTRLTTAPHDYGPDGDSKIRAIWSPDYVPEPVATPLIRMSLDPLDRKMLVQLMAGYDETAAGTRSKYSPRASRTHRLMLSSLGGLLDAEGNWTSRPAGVGLEQWRHLSTLGRDHYVRVIYAGYLCPFGHHASLVKVTERKFESMGGNLNQRVAVLRQRFFIVVREPVKTYSAAGSAPGWFDFPFNRVEILTKVTPNLLAPGQPGTLLPNTGNKIYSLVPQRAAFWPMLGSGDFRFEVAAEDICGNRVTFAMPLLFIGDEANQSKPALDEIILEYDASIPGKRTGPINGATVGFALKKDGAEGDPNLPATAVSYKTTFANRNVLEPRFDPHFDVASVGIRQIQRLLGHQSVVDVEYPEVYKSSGFGGANTGELYLKLKTPHELAFGGGAGQAKSDSLGALASPAMAIQGLSRVMGPVAAQPPSGGKTVEDALKNVIGSKFDPADFFKGAKILGGVDLSTILEIATALTGSDVPKMVSRDLPDKVEAAFHWQTEIKKSDPLNLLVPGAGGKATILSMDGKVSAPIGDPAGATFDANAGMTNFKVNLFGFIIIWFDGITFKASRGKKPDVAVEMHPGDDAIAFGGPLEFVNDLRKFIPSNGFSDPPSLSVTPSGIAASFSLSLPSIGVGIFALSNVSIGAGFSLPFDARPVEVKFNFSERQHPFSLTISLLGGGGFFAIGIGTEGVREIEAALEFGAAVAIDLGVASGSVEIKAGVYFHWLESSGTRTVELSGYVRLHGELSVLGLISASLTFNLQLSYMKQGTKSTVWGEATLTIEIEILFFSASVSATCRREFGGSPSDPTFVDLIPAPSVWADYCIAYAAE